MRTKRTIQMSISEIFADHESGRELGKISAWLDSHSEILDWASADIRRENLKATGRSGMTIESILRAGILSRYWQWTMKTWLFI